VEQRVYSKQSMYVKKNSKNYLRLPIPCLNCCQLERTAWFSGREAAAGCGGGRDGGRGGTRVVLGSEGGGGGVGALSRLELEVMLDHPPRAEALADGGGGGGGSSAGGGG